MGKQAAMLDVGRLGTYRGLYKNNSLGICKSSFSKLTANTPRISANSSRTLSIQGNSLKR